MFLKEILTELKARKKCTSGYQFGPTYLGKSKPYYSVLKARNEEPSLDAIVVLEHKLLNDTEVADLGRKVTAYKEQTIARIIKEAG